MVNVNRSPSEISARRMAGAALAAFAILMMLAFWFVGRPLVRFASEPERFRQWVDMNGAWGRLAFVGMMALQIFVAIIPGEPLEIGAGYAFGALEGTMLCLLGAVAGSAVVFMMVRRFGTKMVEAFFPREKIRKLKFVQNARQLELLVFLLMFIPGTPKDMIAYFVGLTRMKLRTWILINATARIPSIITSTLGGDALGTGNYEFAGIVFAVTILISLIGVVIYRRMSHGDGGGEHESRRNSD